MANEYLVNSADLSSVADAIREKGGTTDPLVFPEGFVLAIQEIEGGGGSTSPIPTFTYDPADGYELVTDEEKGIWKIRFLKSGKLTFTSISQTIDIFVVGGGGGASGHDGIGVPSGGGGYTTTKIGYHPLANVEYTITVGAGGSAGKSDGDGGRGGTSSAFNVSAEGGYGALYAEGFGGDGGSGGNGYMSSAAGATNGEDGVDGTGGYTGGKGQGETTREFGDSDGTLYASGGATNSSGKAGAANTGNGGGKPKSSSAGAGTAGGSGIVIIRGVLS